MKQRRRRHVIPAQAGMQERRGSHGLPMNRWGSGERGEIENRPNPEGDVHHEVAICAPRVAVPTIAPPTSRGSVIALLFSAACHPSIIGGDDVSADPPKPVMAALHAHLRRLTSLFREAAGGHAEHC